ncbi:MAG TPA: hypothetical protein VEH84_00065 [Alphaproteobacteria bacterium]|nr:hypothetical protein [Alphaproteobacteria bacterium]
MSYALCGLRVESDLPLPELLPWRGDDRPADIEIRLGEVPDRLEGAVHEGPLLQVAADGTCRYAIAGVAAYRVAGGRHVTVQPWMEPTATDIRVFLLGSVFGFLCHQRGLLPLHAGCVEIGGHVVALAGPSGVGKSTLTAAFLRRGFRVLADDVTVVDVAAPGGPLVLPSFPRVKLWRDAMDGLGVAPDGLVRVRREMDKFQLPLPGAAFLAEPRPLAAVYHLGVAGDERNAGIDPLRGTAAVSALVEAVYRQNAALRIRKSTLLGDVMRVAKLSTARFGRMPDLSALDAAVSAIAAHNGADAAR